MLRGLDMPICQHLGPLHLLQYEADVSLPSSRACAWREKNKRGAVFVLEYGTTDESHLWSHVPTFFANGEVVKL